MPDTTPSSSHMSQEQKNWMLTQSYTRLMHGKTRECIILLQSLQVLCPNDPAIYSMLSYALLEDGNPEECLQMVDKYLEFATPEKQDIREMEWIRKRAQLRIDKNRTNSDNSSAAS